jgi:hypothetical protein
MPTLEQLFKNRQLPSQGGKTAEEAYDIRNSKDIRISAADPFVNTVGMSLARLARKNLGAKGSETLLEEEVTGARLIRTASMPFIYGSELPRLTLRTTTLLDTMRAATGGDDGGGGPLGNLIKKGRDAVLNSKFLGIPQTIIPTKVATNKLIKEMLAGTSDSADSGQIQKNYLQTLKSVKEAGEGKPLGQFLKGLGGGNIKDIGKQALGSALKLGKDKLRGALFGGAPTTGFNGASLAGLKNTTTNYGSISVPGEINRTADNYGVIDVKGLMYSKTFDLKLPPKVEIPMWGVDLDGVNSKGTDTRVGLDNNKQNDPNPNKLDFVDISDEGGLGGRYSKALKDLDTPNKILFSSNPDRKGKSFASKIKRPISKDDFIEKKRGMGQISDTINKTSIFDGDTKDLGNGSTLDDYDFVPLKFTSVHTNKTVQFRATLSGLTEALSPSWDSHKFIGSPFSNYTYSGIERSVTFNFKVYSLNAEEHKIGWDKINFLNSLVFPQGYYDSSAIVPPFIKLTIGDLYKGKLSFIESLSHTWDDSTPWNVTNKEHKVSVNDANTITGTSEDADIDMKGYRLPFITDVAMSVKFLLSKNNTSSKKFYSFTPTT